jgi:hypothetical protein
MLEVLRDINDTIEIRLTSSSNNAGEISPLFTKTGGKKGLERSLSAL